MIAARMIRKAPSAIRIYTHVPNFPSATEVLRVWTDGELFGGFVGVVGGEASCFPPVPSFELGIAKNEPLPTDGTEATSCGVLLTGIAARL